MLEKVLNDIDEAREATLQKFKDFLSIASVSTDPERAGDCQLCAVWLAEEMKSAGLKTEIMTTPRHPVVLGRNEFKQGRPTVLIYGHYDVQPPDPLEQWITPAFEPTVRNGAIVARGSADDKGQVWAHVSAIAAWHRHGGAPVNLIVLIEGEEEIGSPNLKPFVRANQSQLKADIAVVSDTEQFAKGIPAITYGLRGLAYMEVFITAADHDLHSGLYGGSVPNPSNVLCELLATLHDRDGRVMIDGFYDDVLQLSDEERATWKKLPFDERAFIEELKVPGLFGEKGFSTLERRWARPTCDINGLTSGYQGKGAKTIIPSAASAKVSMRLVPNQDPAKIVAAFESTLRQRCPGTVKLEVVAHGSTPAVLVPRDGKAIQFAINAMQKGFGQTPILMREGGTIPVVGTFKSALGIDTLLVGFGLPDDRIHSPNEKFDLDCLHNGVRTCAALYGELSRL